MTNGQRKFVEAVAQQMYGVEFFSAGGSDTCEDCSEETEAFFGQSDCDSCGSRLGGNRNPSHGRIDGQIYHFDICDDCLLYHVYGDLPLG